MVHVLSGGKVMGRTVPASAASDRPAPRATIASAIGTKRGSKQGSWRPRVRISVGSPVRVTVRWGRDRLLVGFTAARQTIGLAAADATQHAAVPIRFRADAPVCLRTNKSLFWLPRAVATPKPAPYSNAITAGNDNSALARSAFSLSKTGSPQPGGTPVATISQTPPMESCSLPHFFDERDHSGCGSRLGATDGRRFDLLKRDRFWIGDLCDDGTDLLHVSKNRELLESQGVSWRPPLPPRGRPFRGRWNGRRHDNRGSRIWRRT